MTCTSYGSCKKSGFTPLEFLKTFSRAKRDDQKALTGFTLIELLVVIAIIGLLASIVMVSLNSVRAKARDTKRLAEIKQIRTAIDMYYDNNNGAYPSSGGTGKCLGLSDSQTCWTGTVSGSTSLNTALAPYLKIPFDPLYGQRAKGNVYLYADANSNTAYHCSGASYPKGPFLLWVPDKGAAYSDSADCGNLGFYTCCGSATSCAEGYSCAYQIQ